MKGIVHRFKTENWSRYRRLIVYFMDIFIMCVVSATLYLIGPVGEDRTMENLASVGQNLLCLFLCISVFLILFKSYDSLWRYAENREYMVLLIGVCCGTALFWILSTVLFERTLPGYYLLSVVTSSLLVMILARFMYRMYRNKENLAEYKGRDKEHEKRRLVVVGAGNAGALLLKEMRTYPNNSCEIVCFVDDDKIKQGRHLSGVPVRGPINDITKIAEEYHAAEILFAIPSCDEERRREILQLCTNTACRIRMLPDHMATLGNRGESLIAQMRNVQVEDLLGRKPVNIRDKNTHELLNGKVILVTGGGGSIGSELCRQILRNEPRQLVVYDIYENNAYELQQELQKILPDGMELNIEIGSVRDIRKLEYVFAKYRPDLVFHAAAHKHVPLMENNPEEAVKNNVFGTYYLARTAAKYNVKKFVLISTDKAVNPTNVMGASKRFCEMILQSMRHRSNTKFVAVRFGNVLGSNGSVIPLFRKQIEQGGPVTITDKRIIRYFMTIPEAAQLVLQAGALAQRSEVFVLDMGEPVKILELAEKLIRLSGFVPYQEIPIIETGLRPGEKLYEELLVKGENLSLTENNMIFVETQQELPEERMDFMLKALQKAITASDYGSIRDLLHQFVPSFREPEDVNREAIEQAKQGHDLKSTATRATLTLSKEEIEIELDGVMH